ncbi:MAG: transposase [Lachnospiraceae bacterium]|nr:transposase [Lachnospiraceae bacterium]
MPRKARVESKTKIYHVMSRALNKQILFDDEKDYLKFLHIVKSTKSEIDFDLYGYCIMSNHYHLLIKDKSNKLSAIMNKINSRYANYYNLKNARTGYVFNDRYHSENVENVKYFLTCLRYIHQNPIKAGICNKTYEYKFSSIHAYRRDKGNYLDLVNTKFIKEKFDNYEFLKWNELDNHDRCMEIMNNRLTDDDVTKLLYKYMNINTKKEYLQASEEEKVIAILNLIDCSIPLMQLSRVTGFYYNKLQKLRIGKDGNTVSLTYKR